MRWPSISFLRCLFPRIQILQRAHSGHLVKTLVRTGQNLNRATMSYSPFADGVHNSTVAPEKFRQARDNSQAFYGYRDLVDLAQQAALADPGLRPAAETLKQSVAAAVIAEKHSDAYPRAHGLQVETRRNVPLEDYEMSAGEWLEDYRRNAFSLATGWERTWDKLDA